MLCAKRRRNEPEERCCQPFFMEPGADTLVTNGPILSPEEQITPLLAGTLDNLTKQGFKVIVMLTGHYPGEQTGMMKRLIQEAQKRHPQVKFLGLSEPEITTPLPGDTYAGDHAAKYETSIALALNPAWVQMDKLKEGRDPSKIVLPETPRKEGTPYNPTPSAIRYSWARSAIYSFPGNG